MEPLVTIAIPAYKAAHLHESIASALGQTYRNTEIVIVNDQSPEDVDSVVRAFDDPRIRYFVNERNVGKGDPSRNWNECLHHARGEWFCLLCDDDQYAPTFVESMLRLSARYPQCHVLRSCVSVTDALGRETQRYPVSPEWETTEQYMWALYNGCRRQTISEFMLHRPTMLRLGGYVHLPYAWGADNLSVFRFSLQHGIASAGECLTLFRDSGENISSDRRDMDRKLQAFQQYMDMVRQMVREEGFRADLLPLIDAYYRQACVDHMVEADRRAFWNIVRHSACLHISLVTVLRAFIRKYMKI
ncbi:MAG: glycosyltransferase family 2 protein [Bacteroidaceae bacterium]|nr:glycosyltransferase family 2 protein [Bacteroidaceae bacterium]